MSEIVAYATFRIDHTSPTCLNTQFEHTFENKRLIYKSSANSINYSFVLY